MLVSFFTIQVIDLNIVTFVFEMLVGLRLSIRSTQFDFEKMSLQVIFLCCFVNLALGHSALDLNCMFNFVDSVSKNLNNFYLFAMIFQREKLRQIQIQIQSATILMRLFHIRLQGEMKA